MKKEQLKGNSISESLLNKNTYYVLLSSRESSANLRCDIAMLRKSFFENKKKTLKISKEVTSSGIEGNLTGKITKSSLTWKKTEGGINTEECYKNKGVYVLVNRDLNGNIKNKIYYNKNMLWIKTEYFGVNDFVNAEIIFKPVNTENAIERFTYDNLKRNYASTLLYPTPYKNDSEERSFLDAALPEEKLLVSTEEGEFIYCTKDELENRTKLQENLKQSLSFLNSIWNSGGFTFTDTDLSATTENKPAETTEILSNEEPEQEAANEETKEEIKENTENSASVKNEVTAEANEAIPSENAKDEIIPQEEIIEPKKGKIEVEETYTAENGEKYGEKLIYTGTLIEGKRNGRGRTDRKSGLTTFDGEYLDNKRDGFGCSYYKNGNLSYAGFWKEDKKNGMGVSFRNSDHAVQITSWNEGKPECHTSIFDNEGYLKYTGNIKDGVKNGLCITYNKEEGGLFAGKWLQNGEMGSGALFDSEGNLIYAGFLKDGKREGQGTEFDKDGEIVFTGTFENDKYSKGTLYKKI